jgi:TPR repeat protein
MNLLSFYRRVRPHDPTANAKAKRARAEQGDANAQFSQGVECEGKDPHEFRQAAAWYRQAAERGHALAQYRLGLMYANGQGVPHDAAEALTWIRRAAEGGAAAAQHNLGGRCHRASIHERQEDVIESRIEAFKWLSLASAQSHQGSAAACERVTLSMTGEEVAEGNHRTAKFARRSHPQPAEPLQES